MVKLFCYNFPAVPPFQLSSRPDSLCHCHIIYTQYLAAEMETAQQCLIESTKIVCVRLQDKPSLQGVLRRMGWDEIQKIGKAFLEKSVGGSIIRSPVM